MSELLEDAPTLPEEEPVFQSSGVAFEVKSEDGHPVLQMIGIFVFVICGLGFANGLDFINPESGLVRPHEWINGMAQGAPHDSAEFSGTITSQGENYPVGEEEDLYVKEVIIEQPGEGYVEGDIIGEFEICGVDSIGGITCVKTPDSPYTDLPRINFNVGTGAVLRPIMTTEIPQTKVVEVIDCVT